MKNLKLILFCLLVFHLKVSAQNQQRVWHMNGQSIDFTVANPQFSPISGGGGWAQAFNGVHDSNGNTIFYLDNYIVYNSSGTSIGSLNTTAVSEIAIVPVPGSCTKYYVITLFGFNLTGVSWEYAIVDMSANSGAGSVTSNGITLGSGSIYDQSGIAVGKLKANGTRDCYIVGGGFNTTILKYTIGANGISGPTTLLTLAQLDIAGIAELELSNAGDKLVFGSRSAVNIIHLNANGNINTTLGVNGYTKLLTSGIQSTHYVGGVEFSDTDNNLFVAINGVGIYFFNLVNGTFNSLSNNTSYGNSQLESVYSNGQYRIYAANWNDLAEISNINSTLPTIIHNKIGGLNHTQNQYNSVNQLPDQLDGMDYTALSSSVKLEPETEYYSCREDFPTICPTGANANTQWRYNAGVAMVIVHTGACYTPTQPGDYVLVNSGDCYSTATFSIIDTCAPCNADFKVLTNSMGNGMSSVVVQLTDPNISITYMEVFQNGVSISSGPPQSFMLPSGSYTICIAARNNKTGQECERCQEFCFGEGKTDFEWNGIERAEQWRSESGESSVDDTDVIKSKQLEEDLKPIITPNPSNGTFVISSLNTKAGMSSIMVFDLSSKLVYSQSSIQNQSRISVDLKDQESGIYIVKIMYSDGSVRQQKVVVEK